MASIITSSDSINSELQTGKTNFTVALIILTSLFFMWGFITCMNDILIPFFKKAFELTRFESMMVQFAFFAAYFVGSLVYFLISMFHGDPISKIGYKNGILAGLFISAFASALFYPAAELHSFGFFLTALFILALGFTLLQIAANPYVALLGKPETASSRLNLSQAFNSFGTTIAPILGGYLVFHYFSKMGEPLLNSEGNAVLTEGGEVLSALGIQLPYLIFSGIFILLAVMIYFTDLPKFTNSTSIEKSAGALKYPHLVLGMIAIFMYVGAEVSIGSAYINYAQETLGMAEMDGKRYLAFYWGGAMIGRFMGAISLSSIKQSSKIGLMLVASVASFFLIYILNYIESGFTFEFSNVTPFLIFLAVNFAGFLLGKSLAHKTLLVFSLAAIALLIIAMLSTGSVSLWTITGIGLFNSIMWSNIFTLAIKDLEKHTAQGSSLLVMFVLGGAILPALQGAVADAMSGYHYSFYIPAIAYLYLAYYGWKGYIVKKPVME